jgi:hypothetical protein
MTEENLNINGVNNKIQVDPVSIRAEGSPDYMRLIIPLDLDLHPRVDKPFGIMDIRSSLFIRNREGKIADTLPLANLNTVSITQDVKLPCNLEFPLDAYRITSLENKRQGGDLTINLMLTFIVGIYEPLSEIIDIQKAINILTEISSYNNRLTIGIPQSHWVKNVLPSLGYSEYYLVEIPKGDKLITDAWNYLNKADNAFSRWDTKGVFDNCREAGVLLDSMIKDKFGKDNFTYKERWGRGYANFNSWASLDLHHEDLKKQTKYSSDEIKTSKADAEHLLIVAKSLVKYAEELLKEKGK